MAHHIRRSDIADTEILGRVHAQAWQETYAGIMPADMLARDGSVERRTASRRALFAHSTPDSGHFLIEKDQGDIVGFGDCGPARETRTFAAAEIYTLYLLRSAQGRGWGKKLMLTMFEFLAQRGFDKAALCVLVTNQTALNFYHRLGGVEAGRIAKDYDGTILPEAVFLWHDLKNTVHINT